MVKSLGLWGLQDAGIGLLKRFGGSGVPDGRRLESIGGRAQRTSEHVFQNSSREMLGVEGGSGFRGLGGSRPSSIKAAV